MKTKTMKKRGFTLVELLVVIAIIATLAGVGVPAIIAQKKKGDRSQAIQNAKQVGLGLFSFEEEYGTYPSDSTATDVKENTESEYTLSGPNSNDYFRQLIAAKYIDQERPFYAKTSYTKKPDNVYSTSQKCLSDGECGFSYIMVAGGGALNSSGNSARPVIFAASKKDNTDGECETDVYDNKAVVLRIDNSATVESIQPSSGKIIAGGGKTLLQTGSDTVWGTETTPEVKVPKPVN